MPKKDHTNPKAKEARERKDQQKQVKKLKEQKDKDDALWADDPTTKQQRAAEKEAKALLAAQKRAQKKAMEEKDRADLERDLKGKEKHNIKATRAQILSMQEREAKASQDQAAVLKKAQERWLDPVELEKNINHEIRDQRQVDIEKYGAAGLLEARSLEDAAGLLSGGAGMAAIENHPEKKMRAAFAAYKEKWIPILRVQNPTLKFSQLNDRLFRQWQTSAENPMVQAAAAAKQVAQAAATAKPARPHVFHDPTRA